MKYTNNLDLPLPVAVWLIDDQYDYNNDPKTISATSILKPTKQLVMSTRVNSDSTSVDLSSLIPSRMGSSIHDSLEASWKAPQKALKALGYPSGMVDRVLINPSSEELTEGSVPIYMEQRNSRKLNGWNISGKFDFVMEGKLYDYKTTGAFTYIKQSNADKYIQQGSIYRWLNPDIITEDHMDIIYIFTDWNKAKAISEKDYPKNRILAQTYKLMSLEETELFIKSKLNKLSTYLNATEDLIPQCTDEELWVEPSKYAYYKDPNRMNRSTKNFDNYYEAHQRYLDDGSKGIVVERKSEVKACRYCNAVNICNQGQNYIKEGRLFI